MCVIFIWNGRSAVRKPKQVSTPSPSNTGLVERATCMAACSLAGKGPTRVPTTTRATVVQCSTFGQELWGPPFASILRVSWSLEEDTPCCLCHSLFILCSLCMCFTEALRHFYGRGNLRRQCNCPMTGFFTKTEEMDSICRFFACVQGGPPFSRTQQEV